MQVLTAWQSSSRMVARFAKGFGLWGWQLRRIPKSAGSLNSRTIEYLGISPTGIIFGPLPETSASTATLLALPGRDVHDWVAQLEKPSTHAALVKQYLTFRADLHDSVRQRSDSQKQEIAARYNRGVTQATHHIDDLVMLFQKDTGILEARWRGPFRVSAYGGTHGVSFILQQLNGKAILGTYHGDHLKAFKPRTGYFTDSTPDLPLPPAQTIRKSRKKTYLPCCERLQQGPCSESIDSGNSLLL